MASISKLLLDLRIWAHSPLVFQWVSHSENLFNGRCRSRRRRAAGLMASTPRWAPRGPWGAAGRRGGAGWGVLPAELAWRPVLSALQAHPALQLSPRGGVSILVYRYVGPG